MKPGEKQAKRARILLVDDHPLTRQALRIMINREPDLEVCGEADSRATALTAFQESAPDLAIVDLGLRGFGRFGPRQRHPQPGSGHVHPRLLGAG